MHFLVYQTEHEQWLYSPNREAIADWYKFPGESRWRHMGWLWDGKVSSLEDAKAKVAEYLAAMAAHQTAISKG